MECIMCRGEMQNEHTTYALDSVIVVKNVPSRVCEICGQTTYAHPVAKRLEKMINEFRSCTSEVTVIDYEKDIA